MQCMGGRLITLALLLHVITTTPAPAQALGTEQPCDEQKVPAQRTTALGQTRRALNTAEDCAATCRSTSLATFPQLTS